MSGTRSTAAAIPVLNEKREVTMQKVKVQRYVTGRRPDYAEGPSDESSDSDNDIRTPVVRKIADPVVISLTLTKDEEPEQPSTSSGSMRHRHRHPSDSDSGNEEDHHKGEGDDDEDDVSRRHERIRRIREETEEEELLATHGDDDEEDEDEYESDEEDEDDDSEDDAVPRLKPVFVRKDDRVTVKEREIEEKKEKEREDTAIREAEERRMESLRIIEDDVRREEREKADRAEDEALAAAIDAINTDDEEGEDQDTAYEIWKLRELKRIKRDKDEAEEFIKQEQEKDKLRNMTEEERQAELEKNPKIVTNAAEKGKYKYMQKYYHRGAFYLDQEDEVFKRNVAEPTLEDHFDKTVLPKVMQVKNFGRAGRTKYTHLVDQDTTAHDGPWSAQTLQSQKFVTTQGGGFKPIFERPSKKRKAN